MKRIEIEKPHGTAEDCDLFEKCLQEAKIPFDRIEREASGTIVLWIEEEFEQPAIEALHHAIEAKFGSRAKPPRPASLTKSACGHIEIRMLNLKTIGRFFDDQLVINAGSGICCECDPAKADRREYQARLNERHGLEA